MIRRLTLLALIALGALAQEGVLTLDRWKIHSGDDPRWAAPDFDDRGWADSGPPSYGTPGFTWFRTSVAIPPEWSGRPLALGIAQILEAFEVYVDGERVGGSGVLAPAPQGRFAKHLVFPVSPGVGGPLRIAIRRWLGRNAVSLEYNTHAPQLGLTEHIQTKEALHDLQYGRRRLPILAASLLLMVVGLVALLWFRERPDHPEYLWLGLTMCVTGMGAFSGFLPGELGLPVRSAASSVFPGISFMAVGFSALFFRSIFPRARWLLTADAGLGFLLGLSLGSFHWMDITPWGPAFLAYVYFSRGVRVVTAILLALKKDWSGMTMAAAWVFVIFARRWFGEEGQTAGYLLFGLTCLAVLYFRFREERREQLLRQRELAAGQRVQQLLMENAQNSSPAFHVEKAYLPASEVGGDFYQTIANEDGSLLVVVGDVSGKGLDAAMRGATLLGALRTLRTLSPGEVLRRLNDALCDGRQGGFVTCCCARFAADGSVTIANAGHPAPYAGGREIATEPGLPLGITAGTEYGEIHVAAGPDAFTFISDGVVEAENAQRELFGFERTREISTKSAQEIADAAKAWGQTDDITVVTVRRNA